MANYDDDIDDFDRLAGEPEDPIAGTREILSSAQDVRGDTSLVLGDMSLTDLSQVEQPPPETNPMPWIVAGVLGAILLLLIFAFLLPAQSSVREAQDELESARAELTDLRAEVTRLTADRDEAIEARVALEAESEARAGELEQMARDSEASDAEKRKSAPATKTKRKAKRKTRRRR
jgi:hypothetical protein